MSSTQRRTRAMRLAVALSLTALGSPVAAQPPDWAESGEEVPRAPEGAGGPAASEPGPPGDADAPPEPEATDDDEPDTPPETGSTDGDEAVEGATPEPALPTDAQATGEPAPGEVTVRVGDLTPELFAGEADVAVRTGPTPPGPGAGRPSRAAGPDPGGGRLLRRHP